MGRAVGIDFGTTNTCVAVFDGREITVIPNPEGARTTPSVVGYFGQGAPVVGALAKRGAANHPGETVGAVKRFMGRKSTDPGVGAFAAHVGFDVVSATNGDAWLGPEPAPPAQIASLILAQVRENAEHYLGEPVTQAVITVPAHFDDAQRQATLDAGRIAGLEVLRLLNEPTAAAVASGFLRRGHGGACHRIAVFDMGGGTFDVSLLEQRGHRYDVRAIAGDSQLGGEDFDSRLVAHLAAEVAGTSTRSDAPPAALSDRAALSRLREAAERAKKSCRP